MPDKSGCSGRNPSLYASFASCNSDSLIGSYVKSIRESDALSISSGKVFPVNFSSSTLNDPIAAVLLLFIQFVSLMCASSSFFTTSHIDNDSYIPLDSCVTNSKKNQIFLSCRTFLASRRNAN